MGVVSVSMPDGLIDRIDELVEEHDYSGRSEVVRDASRKLVGEFEDRSLEGQQLAAVISVRYPYDTVDIETELTELRHEYSDRLNSNSHSCIGDNEGCIETFVFEGSLSDVSTVVRDLETVSERLHLDYTLYDVEAIGEDRLWLEE